MITTLDRMILVSFFRSYGIVWTSLISLFVVIDLFTHLDAYVNRPGGVRRSSQAHRAAITGSEFLRCSICSPNRSP